MTKVALFLIDGFEETEALTTVDIMRRGGIDVTMVPLTQKNILTGKHHIPVCADVLFEVMLTSLPKNWPTPKVRVR